MLNTKYLPACLEYPRDIIDHPLPLGVGYEYVSNSFLNGFVNYAKPIKAYVLERYYPWEYEFEKDEFSIKIREPARSFQWVDFVPKTKDELYQKLCEPDRMCHAKLDVDFQDDVLMLSVSEQGTYIFFWFDRDSSDCCIGRFVTDDPRDVVVSAFDEYVKGRTFQYQNRHREIPLTYFRSGWISS